MTPEEYLQSLNDMIYTNNRIIRENQVLQTRILNSTDYIFFNHIFQPNTQTSYTQEQQRQPIENNREVPDQEPRGNSRQSQTQTQSQTQSPQTRQTQNIIQDFILSYIFEPITTSSATSSNTPTLNQINDSTEIVLYDPSNIDIAVCPITLTNFVNGENLRKIRHCGHIFKESSILNWFSRNSLCPLCRYDIRTYVQQNSHSIDDTNPIYTNSIPIETEETDPILQTNDIHYNWYNTTNSTTTRPSINRSRGISPIIRSVSSQLNIPEEYTNEIQDILTQFINFNSNIR